MRIVIQNGKNGSFFGGSEWQAREEDAAQFESVLQAEQFCKAQNLDNALVVLKFEHGGEDIRYRACDRSVPLRSHHPAPVAVLRATA